MYTKVFRSMYDGSLPNNWKALVTFQQMLVLSNQNGVVDSSEDAIARMSGIPIDIILEGIEALEGPDPRSRSKDMEGRRIVRIERGWFLVNFMKYRLLMTKEDKNEADRERIRAKRAAANSGSET